MASKITYTFAKTDDELVQILALQTKNLPVSISADEKQREGFVTVKHNLEILKNMNTVFPHTLAKDGDKVVGYALSMTPDFGNAIEVLKPMFHEIENSTMHHKSYIIMGQICIDKNYRKQGVFRSLYKAMQKFTSPHFEVIITEVDALNERSLNAHYAVGFQLLKTYESEGQDWKLIYLPN